MRTPAASLERLRSYLREASRQIADSAIVRLQQPNVLVATPNL